jgi:hypothetical protein
VRGLLQMDANVQWLDAKAWSFYGFGQDSSKRRAIDTTSIPSRLSTNVSLKPLRPCLPDGQLRLHADRHASRDARLRAGGFARARREADLSRDEGDIAYDWRPAPGYSTRGGYYRASFERNFESSGRPYSFNLQEYEVVQQLPLVREQFVLRAARC